MPNSGFQIARVVIDSNLPQLDREFEYRVPAELTGDIRIGQEILVPFGKAKTPTTGYVVGLSETAEHQGELGSIGSIVHPEVILYESTYRLIRTLAARQSCTTAELLKSVLPTRAVSVDKKLSAAGAPGTSQLATGKRTSSLVAPAANAQGNMVNFALEKARQRISAGESVLILAPDDRAVNQFASALSAAGIEPILYSAALTRVEKYSRFLAVARTPATVTIGTRSAAFLPIRDLGLVLMWDEGDQSYIEQSAPYLSTREVLLVRQQLENFDVAFFGNSISTDLQRLCEIGYVQVELGAFKKPAIAASDDSLRVDSLAWKAIQQSIAASRPVLVQVSSRGTASSAFCKDCRERVRCNICAGPIWLDSNGRPSCRWCNAIQLQARCQTCSGNEFVSGRAGATRTAAEFGKAFPGARVIESSGEHVITQAPTGKVIVVATPGAEPEVDGGYGAVVLLDAGNLLARDTLRAREEALRLWANAVSYVANDGRVTITGITGELAQGFCLWNIRELISQEFSSRRELAFPPAVRMASVIGSEQLVLQLAQQLSGDERYVALGPLPVQGHKQKIADEWRLLVKYPYAATLELATTLKAFQLEASISSKAINARSGRAMRPVRVRMDEVEVI